MGRHEHVGHAPGSVSGDGTFRRRFSIGLTANLTFDLRSRGPCLSGFLPLLSACRLSFSSGRLMRPFLLVLSLFLVVDWPEKEGKKGERGERK